jgi:hypothetical protein
VYNSRIGTATVAACLLAATACKRKPEPFGAERKLEAMRNANSAGTTVIRALPSQPSVPTFATPPTLSHDDPEGEMDRERLQTKRFLNLRSARMIGHTSVVLKLQSQDGHKAAFKPISKVGGKRFLGEVAARELGEVLGIQAHLPDAVFVSLPRQSLLGLVPELDAETPSRERLEGALIPWIDDLTFPPLEKNPSTWLAWLDGTRPIPDDEQTLAGELSTLMIFDYLTGNFDRMSGGNFGKSQGKLLFIDNDGAFLHPMPEKPLQDARKRMLRVRRISKTFAAALFANDVAKRWSTLTGAKLLPEAARAGFVTRLGEVQAHLKEGLGNDSIRYAFP